MTDWEATWPLTVCGCRCPRERNLHLIGKVLEYVRQACFKHIWLCHLLYVPLHVTFSSFQILFSFSKCTSMTFHLFWACGMMYWQNFYWAMTSSYFVSYIMISDSHAFWCLHVNYGLKLHMMFKMFNRNYLGLRMWKEHRIKHVALKYSRWTFLISGQKINE